MIWRLPHPVRGAIAFAVVWVAGAALIGFGMGVVEMVVLTLVAAVAFGLVSQRTPSER